MLSFGTSVFFVFLTEKSLFPFNVRSFSFAPPFTVISPVNEITLFALLFPSKTTKAALSFLGNIKELMALLSITEVSICSPVGMEMR